MSRQRIPVAANIAPQFYEVHEDLKIAGHSEYWLMGGRGSTKSSFASLEIIIGLLKDKNANAIVYRRYGNTMKDSVYSQLIWAIDTLGMMDFFKLKIAPLEIVYKPTGQRILFRGMDDPQKSKSIKLQQGVFRYLWFEELSEFRGMEDIRTVKQSILRGVDRAFTIYSYNPPKSAQNWVNGEALKTVPDRLNHLSTYLDVPPSWLGEQFLSDAESLKKTNDLAYRNEYLGEVTGTGGNVFENLKIRTITDDEIKSFQWFYQGVDWGYFPDPFAWVRMAYDSRKQILYIVDEHRANKQSNKETFDAVKSRLNLYEPLTADSAEPKSISDWKQYGAYWMHGVVKGAGSVAYSMKWLSSLSEIVIDPKRCPNAAQEFQQYEYERTASGEFCSGYVDANNHFLDATRYAMFPVWKRKGE